MRISLIYPRFEQLVRSPPLGVAYIAAVLREAGHIVNIIDPTFGMTWKQLETELIKAGPDLIGISCMTPMVKDALGIAKVAKRILDCPIIFGGSHPSILPESIVCNEDVDYVVEGEGEITICELVQSLEQRADAGKVLGMWYKENGKVKRTAPRPYIENLDQIPFPARDLLSREYFKYGHANMIASRGCPFNCSYCQPVLRKLFGRKIRFRSPQNVVDEMEHLKDEMRIKHVMFEDDTFTVYHRWATEFCSEMKKRNLDMQWTCNSRVDTVDRDLFVKMKNCGCTRISFGVESGSQEILDTLSKGITVDDIVSAFELCKEVGIRTHAYLMIGSPGETEQTIRDTTDLIHKIKPDEIYISITTPFPATKLYEDLRERRMILAERWEDFDYYSKCSVKLENFTSSEILETRKRIMRDFWFGKTLDPSYLVYKIKELHSIHLLWQRLLLLKRILAD